MHKTYFYALVLISLAACQQKAKPTSLKSFYYPMAELKEGLVYEYVNDETKQVAHYYFMKTVEDSAGNWSLVATRYNTQFEQDMLSREGLVANGTVCQDYRFFVKDSATQKVNGYPAQLEATTVFPFDIPKDSNQVYRFRMTFALPPDLDMNIRFTRDRKFARFEEYEWEGKKQQAAVFENLDYIQLTDTVKGGFWTVDSSQMTEIYVENIGMVYSAKQLPSKQFIKSRLKARYTMEEFLKKQK